MFKCKIVAALPWEELRTLLSMFLCLVIMNFKFRNCFMHKNRSIKEAGKVCGDSQDLKSRGTRHKNIQNQHFNAEMGRQSLARKKTCDWWRRGLGDSQELLQDANLLNAGLEHSRSNLAFEARYNLVRYALLCHIGNTGNKMFAIIIYLLSECIGKDQFELCSKYDKEYALTSYSDKS